ncbi:MAG: glycoside hydrolase family 2 TIM barrel-domain containing protein [Bacteroidota bacterium]
MKTKIFIIRFILPCCLVTFFSFSTAAAKGIVNIPNVKNPQISLNGLWKINLSPEKDFQLNNIKTDSWADIHVPGEPAMQGFKVQYNKPFAYKKQIVIPDDYQDNSIFIGFDGVYSFARVWINGNLVKSHSGGFTSWNCDISQFVKAGESAWLTVEVTDKKDDISGASAYAHHPIGGILRDVYLFARPVKHIEKLHVETDFDKTYTDASLSLNYKVSAGLPANAILQFKLTDMQGKEVALPLKKFGLKSTESGMIEIPIKSPLKWEAEHPNLYTLEVTLIADGKTIEKVSQRIGFREIIIAGNQLLVNGKNVMLRGTCRHDVSADYGRCTTKELDETDVRLIKDANLNYVRTSHYPPSRAFLDFCDEYGLFVEEEAAICFTQNGSENDTTYTGRYLSQFGEMIERDRNHASIIMWSLGNESVWGINFQKEYEYAKATDPIRPVIFPNFGGIPEGVKCFDLNYVHYPTYQGNNLYHAESRYFSNPDELVLNDEWAHVPCYITETFKDEQGARDFWGESIKRFWDNISVSDGAGGAIWCMVDEYFMLPDSCKGTGEWGWVDVWRRKKPEFWHVKKTHSPVSVTTTAIENFKAGLPLLIAVTNRYDFTNLNEINISWASLKASGIIKNADIAPRSKGVIEIPANNWQRGDTISLQFMTKEKQLIDAYQISLGTRAISFTYPPNEELVKTETEDRIIITTGPYLFEIDKASGLFDAILFDKDTLVYNGPFLNLTAMNPCHEVFYTKCPITTWNGKDWKLKELKAEVTPTMVKIISKGSVDSLVVNFEFLIRSGGIFSVGYEIENPPAWQIQETGIWFKLPDQYRQISWDRNALWSSYPDDHIGRPIGESLLYNPGTLESYRTTPKHKWNMDSKCGYFYYGPEGTDKEFHDLANEAKCLKTSLNFYELICNDGVKRLRVESNGSLAARVVKSSLGSINLLVNNEWDYVNLNWGNFEHNIHISNNYKNLIRFRLADSKSNIKVTY